MTSRMERSFGAYFVIQCRICVGLFRWGCMEIRVCVVFVARDGRC